MRGLFRDYYGLRRPWVVVSGVLFAFAGLLAAVFGVAVYLESRSCAQGADKYGLAHDYGVTLGCYVQLEDGRWVDKDSLRFTQSGELSVDER